VSEFAAIPEPGATLESVLDAVRALKNNVELLIGQRGNSPSARLFYQIAAPKSSETRIGDFWVRKDTKALLYWDGREWMALA
jgi:hypothetical protein